MRRIYVLAAISVLLSACIPTVEGYQQLVESYVGASEGDLVSQWGPPQNVYTTGNKKYLTYVNQRSIYIPGSAPTYTTTVIGNTAYTNSYGGTAGRYIDAVCETTFVMSGSKIENVSFRGNDCAAVPEEK